MSDKEKLSEALSELKRTLDELEKSLDILEKSIYNIANNRLSKKAQLKLVKNEDDR